MTASVPVRMHFKTQEALPVRILNGLMWLTVAPLLIVACTRGNERVAGFRVNPDVAAVQNCASSIAISEGYDISARNGTVNSPSDGMNRTEGLQVRVRLTADSALPEPRIRTATTSGRNSAPVSPAGHRIVDRVSRECRFARLRAG